MNWDFFEADNSSTFIRYLSLSKNAFEAFKVNEPVSNIENGEIIKLGY